MSQAPTISIPVMNMSCGGCVGRAARALEGVKGIDAVTVNLADETAHFVARSNQAKTEAIAVLDQAGYPAATQTITLAITGLSCASCVGRLDTALRSVPGVVEAQVNLADETAHLRYVAGITSPAELMAASADAGYPGTVLEQGQMPDRAATKAEEAETHKRAMILAMALALPVFVLEMGGHMVPALHHLIARTIGHQTSWIIQFILTTLVLIGPGRAFFAQGGRALLRRAPNMDSLVALGAGAAWSYSTVALFLPALLPQDSRVVYFEAAAVIVALILLGRWFEARAKGQTGSAIQKLIGLQPRTAMVQSGADWIETSIEDLRPGDIFRTRPGERIAIDAEVKTGTGSVDESMITGEPMPVVKSPGDALTGGTINGTGSLTCVVTRTGQDTTLSQIIKMVQQAQNARLPIQALVDRVTLWFVPAVLLIAVLTVVIWFLFGPAPVVSHALVAGVSVLIIACPCAMGLATPTSIMVGTGRAAQLGVLFRQGDALQSLSGVDVVAFDKTGTLTEGRPSLTALQIAPGFDRAEVLSHIAAVEALSEHPVARAVVAAAQAEGVPTAVAEGFEALSGQGVTARVTGDLIRIGNAAMMADAGIDISELQQDAAKLAEDGKTVFLAARGDHAIALIAVSDPIKAESRDAIAALKSRGIEIAMITGDGEKTGQAVARALGIDKVIAEVLPEGKINALDGLGGPDRRVAFVGDGINDAPVLAHADVGIAIGTGTDVAIETADVVLMSGTLDGVVAAFDISRLTLRNIRQNLVWAFGYNILLIPVAAGLLYPAFGMLLSPAMAAGAMAFSSVFVLTNALRLRRAGGIT